MDEIEYAVAWHAASSLADAGEMVATFLEVPMPWAPGHLAPPNPETTDLVPVLAAINRAGFVTGSSQPGEIDEAAARRQRASVSGYCGGELLETLRSLELDSDLVVAAHAPGVQDGQLGWVVTTWDGEPTTWGGMPIDHGTIELWYGDVAPRMVDVVKRAWQIEIIDPHWGRDDLLWPKVLEALTSPAAGRPASM